MQGEKKAGAVFAVSCARLWTINHTCYEGLSLGPTLMWLSPPLSHCVVGLKLGKVGMS